MACGQPGAHSSWPLLWVDRACAQRSGIEGDLVPLPHCSHRVRLLRQPAPPTLRRWRKDFLQLCAAHPPATEEDAASRFATFLDGRLQG